MPDWRYPGVYIPETVSLPPVVRGVDTRVAAIVGRFAEGPVNEPFKVSSEREFEQVFGGISPQYPSAYAVQQFFQNGGAGLWLVRVPEVSTGDSAALMSALLTGNAPDGGIRAVDGIDDVIAILLAPDAAALPDEQGRAVYRSLIAMAQRCLAMVILDTGSEVNSVNAMQQWLVDNVELRSASSCVYFPRLLTPDLDNPGQLLDIPASGAIAGCWARHDTESGVWKAPAGSAARLVGIAALTVAVSTLEQAPLNAQGVNVLRNFPAYGNLLWGARTLADADKTASQWKYLSARRLALFIESSIARSLSWAAFERHDELLWRRVRESVSSFLEGLYREGAFAGAKSDAGYFVRCGLSTMSQQDIQAGILRLQVGFAPLRPGEFITLSIHTSIAS